MLATESPPLTIIEEMEVMLLRLGFSQTVAQKLLDDKGIHSPWTIASLSDKEFVIISMIREPGGLVSDKMPESGNQISIIIAKNLKLAVFMFKMMKCCSKAYYIKYVNSISVLQHQHQWKLEQKKADNTKVPKIDKNDWMRTMETIVLHLKLVKGARGAPLAYVVQCHITLIWCLSEP